jgi:hypothetical protein
VPDEDYRGADPSEDTLHRCNVAGERVEAVLSGDHFVSFRLKGRDQFAE